ncbi:hypothetical protein BA190_32020 [Labrys sp. WJW]|uniref:hypothetical protein n=1 Tax=Labrys sp. WJW TaxID=1737983 RepID=UPI000836C2A5|nr:hypothetical protein [Labrys sp. WJW]OCC00805.1 hypothetical protein BA190_32020 [Labrys sp. WJW]
MRALTADNQAALAKAGLPITGANTYMAHFLGAPGAVKFLQALQENPEQSAAELFPAAAASNTGVFYDHNSGGARSLAEVYRRQTAMFGADAGQPVYSAGPGYADAPADPAFADIPPREQDRLLNQASARGREGESLSRGALESGVRDATQDLTTIGRFDGPLPGIADFTKAYGPQAGARHYADFQRVVSLGADIDAIKAMTPAEQSAWLARFTPQGDGPDLDGARDRHARARQAIALNLAFRSKDPNAYVRALNPRIDRLWQEAGNSPERLKAALSATNAAMDRLGMPVEERRLIPKAMVDQALAAFGDRSKPMAQRLAPLRAALVAGADPGAQRAIFGQMVSAGLPPMLEYAAIAYAKGDASLAERFATAALGNADGKATGGAADAPFASPAAAANTPAGPAPMRSLSGPAIDLGPAAAQSLGSSLTGDERTSRAETVRTRLIEDAMRNNGGDRPAAVAQTDRDLASLQGDGWMPGMLMWRTGEQYTQAQTIGTNGEILATDAPTNPASDGGVSRSLNSVLQQAEEAIQRHKSEVNDQYSPGRPATEEEMQRMQRLVDAAEGYLRTDAASVEALRRSAEKLGLLPKAAVTAQQNPAGDKKNSASSNTGVPQQAGSSTTPKTGTGKQANTASNTAVSDPRTSQNLNTPNPNYRQTPYVIIPNNNITTQTIFDKNASFSNMTYDNGELGIPNLAAVGPSTKLDVQPSKFIDKEIYQPIYNENISKLQSVRALKSYIPLFNDVAAKYGINPTFLLEMAKIEAGVGSGRLNSDAVNRSPWKDPKKEAALSKNPYPNAFDPLKERGETAHLGLFQFDKDSAHRVGLIDRFDPVQATEGATRLAISNFKLLEKQINRAPTIGEIYLAHQQGGPRAARLLNNPNKKAAEVIGLKALESNLPKDFMQKNSNWRDMTAAEFSKRYTSKFPEERFYLPNIYAPRDYIWPK